MDSQLGMMDSLMPTHQICNLLRWHCQRQRMCSTKLVQCRMPSAWQLPTCNHSPEEQKDMGEIALPPAASASISNQHHGDPGSQNWTWILKQCQHSTFLFRTWSWSIWNGILDWSHDPLRRSQRQAASFLWAEALPGHPHRSTKASPTLWCRWLLLLAICSTCPTQWTSWTRTHHMVGARQADLGWSSWWRHYPSLLMPTQPLEKLTVSQFSNMDSALQRTLPFSEISCELLHYAFQLPVLSTMDHMRLGQIQAVIANTWLTTSLYLVTGSTTARTLLSLRTLTWPTSMRITRPLPFSFNGQRQLLGKR